MSNIQKNKNENTFFPLWRIFPSIITLFALCLGLNSIRLTFIGRYEIAIFFILGAAFLDSIDGRVARLLGCSSMFGAQLDSLADFLDFGVAPAILIYFVFLSKIKILGWSLITIYVICIAIRLARFNTEITYGNNANSWRANFFYGVPAPAAAILLMLPVILTYNEIPFINKFINNTHIMCYTALISSLAVSHIPTFSLKKIQIHKRFISPILLGFGIITISIIMKPWLSLPILSLIYVFSIPFSIASYYYLAYKEKHK